MLETKEKLWKFIQKEAAREYKKEEEIAERYGFEWIFPELDTTLVIRQMMKQQSVRNVIFLKDLKQLAGEFQEFVLLKGLWYQEKYFEKGEFRFFGDIDLYVVEENFKKLDDALKKNNYDKLYDDSDISSKFYFYYDVFDHTKISFGKLNHYVYEKKEIQWAHVEVHTYPLPYYQYPAVRFGEIYERRKLVSLGGKFKVFVLESNDDFIYAACHLCKHLIHAVIALEESEETIWPACWGRYIYDLASMIDKGELDWNIIVERAKQWDVLQDVLTACRMVQYFLGKSMPEAKLQEISAMVEEDVERGLYKSLVRDIALSDISNVFNGGIVGFVNKNQVNPYCRPVCIRRKDGVKGGTEIIRSKLGTVYSEWDEEFWYLEYEPGTDRSAVMYVGTACPIYGIHAVTFLADCRDGVRISSRNVMFEHRKPAEWLKEIDIYENGRGQYVIKVKFSGLKMEPQKTKSIACQIGIVKFNEEDEIVDRVSLFGKGYYHFYDMGLLELTEETDGQEQF